MSRNEKRNLKEKLAVKSSMSREDLVDLIDGLARGLREQRLHVRHSGRDLTLRNGSHYGLRFEARRQGVRNSLLLCFDWDAPSADLRIRTMLPEDDAEPRPVSAEPIRESDLSADDPRLEYFTWQELYEKAQERDIENRSEMSKAQLWDALRRVGFSMDELSRAELYAKAREADIDGRSEMNKSELVAALEGNVGREVTETDSESD
ncbi:MAG: amphi-Trp domain-containing protein [Candidatus Eisenbacteria bacterium]|uniref:Amphi-Trp domain-containing protein n=1 Tax=Eiseniibacteriota bacterium TaxID=2212470 RepID=A0A956RPR6_UNCEI|nr:amphi-Trp domain-containing protein [Candidatus Eisenbacteria bacterium]